MLKKITIENYRSCFNTSFECHPNLSVLIGPNGSGKTNVLQAVMLLNKMVLKEDHFYREVLAGIPSRLRCTFEHDQNRALLSASLETQTDDSNKDIVARSRQKWKLTNGKGELTRALMKPRKVGFKRFVGKGCGKLRRKCGIWASNLVRQGCSWIVLVHDLDDYNEGKLRALLTNAIAQSGALSSVVLIPRREIESWLLYDRDAIAKAFNERKKPPLPHDPEALQDPKDFLGKLIAKHYDKQYLNTQHNELIAKHINVSLLRKSKSFAPHPLFVAGAKIA